MASLMVTGGAGFIGANFVRYWRRHHPEHSIVVFDLLTYAGNRANLAGLNSIELVVADICDTARVEQVIDEHGIDTIVHFAAESHVDRSITGPDAFVRTNILGTHSLLKAARAQWLTGSGKPHRFHNVSTDEVFGSLGLDDPAFNETTPYAPNSPYSASKAAADHLVRAEHRTHGLQTTTSNCSNNYGPLQHPEKLIPLFVTNALLGRRLPIYGDGMNVRDWLHVEDHCRGIEAILLNGRAGETYCIGGGQELSNLTLIDELCLGIDAAFREDPRLAEHFPRAPAGLGSITASLKTHVDDRKGHDFRYAIDDGKARRELNYAPHCNLAEGLAATIAWYFANEAWWRPLIEPQP